MSNLSFELWLEIEVGEPLDQPANRPYQNFCNAMVTVEDGRKYALNLWTFDYFPLACNMDGIGNPQRNKYVLPPDLFVERLTRPVITEVITELLAEGYMRDEWLVPDDE